jgi:cyclophilin family peptidyl-prolyl cis-trans isomerase
MFHLSQPANEQMRQSKYLILVIALVLIAPVISGCGSTPEEPSPTPEPTSEPTPIATPTATPIPTPTPIEIPMVDTDKQYTAIIKTEKGDLVLELYASDAPITVSNFVHLARQGYYDGTTFHRVIPGFMAQGGDPTGTGRGNPGYFIPDEINQPTHVAGALSMANMGVPNTGGSQFFITYEPKHNLDGRHTVFGHLIEGTDVLESLTPRDPDENPDYEGDSIIQIVIVES